ncbi:MAG: serine hydrolase [Proteobacteria bacterium]|nr:serine hydrolase [Pseudomonadota bacterium]
MQDKILNPLNMDNTYFSVPQDKIDTLSEGYIGNLPSIHWFLQDFYQLAGGLISCAKDMMNFLQVFAHLKESPLTEGIALVQKQHFQDINSGESIGLGVGIYEDYYMHTGGTNGFSSTFIVKPADDKGNGGEISLVLLTLLLTSRICQQNC